MRLTVSICALMIATTMIAAFQFMSSPASARSTRFCENYAHDYATRRSRGNVVGSTVLGGGGGAVIGGIANGRRGARRGAAIGAGTGLILGGSARNSNYNHYYQRAFRRCMHR